MKISKKLGQKIAELINSRDTSVIMMREMTVAHKWLEYRRYAHLYVTASDNLVALGIPVVGQESYSKYREGDYNAR